MDSKRVVRAGYEVAASRYDEWSARVDATPRHRYLTKIGTLLRPGSRILELGCGTGLVTRELCEHFDVVALDFASACLEHARAVAPKASFVRGDMTEFSCTRHSFDAVVGFSSIIHVPRAEQPAVLRNAAEWLRAGGLLLANLGIGDSEVEFQADWRGVPMYWSSFDAAANLHMVDEAGFDVVEADEVAQVEDGLDVTFQWFVARRRAVRLEPSAPVGS